MAFSAESLGVKNKYIQQLLEEGTSTKPIQSHWQGAARLANALLGGWEMGEADRRDKEGPKELLAILSGQGGQSPVPTMPMPTQAPPQAPQMRTASLPPQTMDDAPQMAPRPTGGVQQATEGIISAVPDSGPNAGRNIAPGVQMAQGLGNASDNQIRMMIGSQNPSVREFGIGLLKQRMAPEKATDEMREYQLARQQGFNGSFFDFKTQLKRAGAIQNQVTIDQKGETEFEKKSASHQAERFNEVVKGGQEAQTLIADLNSLKDIGGRIKTGKTAQITAALGPYAEAVGIKIDGLDDMQAYQAIVSKLAPRMRVVGSGATSDFEMQQFLKALPSLGNTPGGNETISQTLTMLQQHKLQAAEIASRAMSGQLRREQAEKMLRELPDPLSMWKEQRKATQKSLKDKYGLD
jgi:hypothetical protein